jgi:signal transduction histidine kinase
MSASRTFFELDFLSTSAMELVELSLDQDIYEFIGRKLHDLAGDSYILVNSIDSTRDVFVLRSVKGLGKLLNPIQKLIGAQLVGFIAPVPEEAREVLTGTGLVKGPKSIYELAAGALPAPICGALEKLLKMGEIFGMGFCRHGRLFGDVIIIARAGQELKNRELIAAFVNQAAVALQRRQAEEDLYRLNRDLERIIAERTAELEEANRELESFAYSVSHDLRTPLVAVEGFSKLLEEQCAGVLGEDGLSLIAHIKHAASEMTGLINALLNLSRASKSAISMERINLSSMVASIARDLKARDPERSVDFVIQDGVTADGDATLLHIAMQNLLHNAWKFTAGIPKACIKFGIEPRKGKREYYVRDNGVGLDMGKASAIFRPFQRFHSSAKFQGSGIGLATVRRIVQRHGGDIRVESSAGRGATFFFTLDSHP